MSSATAVLKVGENEHHPIPENTILQRPVGRGNRVNIRLKPLEMAWLRLLSGRRRRSMAGIAREALKEVFRREGFYGY